MLLLDSLYINNSGGLRLLEYLVAELQSQKVDFYLLADSRCKGIFDSCKHVRYMKASLLNRKKFYKGRESFFSTVLCFGNIPAPVKMEAPVYTYFHNINLLTLGEGRSKKEGFVMWLKREVFRHYKSNTDYWMVQTSNTATELCKNLKEPNEKIKLMPFYELSPELLRIREETHGEDYVYISNYTGAKGHEELLEAWRLLHKRGIKKTLHLTVPETAGVFCDRIKAAKKEGVDVINHGFVPFDVVVELYKQSKAIIYPSHNESLGLGIIEAITAGCDVIGADLPYMHAICEPSGIFDPHQADSIVDAVEEYERGYAGKSVLNINNQIDELIELLITNQQRQHNV